MPKNKKFDQILLWLQFSLWLGFAVEMIVVVGAICYFADLARWWR